MSAPTKLRGGSESELTRLKSVWRGMSDDARSFWSELFISDTPQADIRSQLLAKLKINLRFDKQLNAFRRWIADQEMRDLQAERIQENETRLQTEHPDWTLDQVREEVLRQSYLETLAAGNFKLGLATVKQDLNCKKVSLDARKMALLEKKAAQADSAAQVTASNLTPAEKDAEYRRIFGMS